MSNLALDKCTDTALGVTNHLDILYFCVFRQMFRKQARELLLINGRREAGEIISVPESNERTIACIHYLPTKTLAS